MTTETQRQYWQILEEICAGNGDALEWCRSVLDFVNVWDDVVDGDNPVMDGDAVSDALQDALVEWVRNPFWQRFGPQLAIALGNCVCDWRESNRSGDRSGAYTPAVHLGLMVAQCLGGMRLAMDYNQRLHEVVHEEMIADAMERN